MAQTWKILPLLEALRPETGWRVEQALISTYSADLCVVMAVLLALSGRDNERGSARGVASMLPRR